MHGPLLVELTGGDNSATPAVTGQIRISPKECRHVSSIHTVCTSDVHTSILMMLDTYRYIVID